MLAFQPRIVCLAAAAVLAGGLGGGCQTWLSLPGKSPPSADAAQRPSAAAPTKAGGDVRATLANAGWARGIVASGSAGQPVRRWRHAGLDDLLSRPADQHGDFRRLLADRDAAVAANAAIALARLNDAAAMPQLVQAVRSPQHLPAFRCAACEALGEVQQPEVAATLRELLDQYGDPAGKNRVVYQPDLHAELLHGLARHVDPAEEPRFTQALESPAWAVRAEAVQAWRESRVPTLPSAVGAHHLDGDPRVRAAVLRVASARRDAAAFEWCKAALGDTDFQVRLAAIAGLGQCGHPEAVGELLKLSENGGEAQRAAAVSALAAAGDRARAGVAQKDSSPMVRRAVAESLARWPDREGASLATAILDDPSREVQQRLFAALADWPLPQLGPVLLAGLDKPSYLTRRSAATLLAARWPPAAEFPVEGAPQQRGEAIARLQERFRREVGFLSHNDVGQALASAQQRNAVSNEALARVEQCMRPLDDPHSSPAERADALRGLSELGPELPAALERLTFDKKAALPADVYRTVLPKCDACFAEIESLGANDPLERRRAAAALAERSEQRPLGKLAIDRIHALALRETDQQVWRSLLTAVAADASSASRALAVVAAGHAAADVRRRACLHFGAHPAAENAAALLPLLADANQAVASAAIDALGRQGRLNDLAPLQRLLNSPSETFRHEAAIALARLGDRAGRDALERMTFHADPAVRREAAVALADIEQTAAIPLLIGLLDDRPTVSGAAMAGLVKVVGYDAAQVAGQAPAVTTEQIRRWKDWHRQRGVGRGARAEELLIRE